ncbi:mechanosensitive ion channel family protein [Lacticaseibacillus daqingensis]|uniref:mechanosensitive ion channel family protein n=1 Tax=Lacticaseibacillus daqingensis TaxID=2486014 RepID=UPI00384EA522
MLTETKDLTTQTNLLLRYLNHIDWDGVLNQAITVVVQLLFFSLLFFVLNAVGKKLVNRGFNTYKTKSRLSDSRIATMHTLTRNAFSYVIFFFYLYAILSTLGVPVGTLIAGAGVVGIALGLGAQGFVSDVVTGFFIILEGQFDVGDSVQLGQISGKVTSVGLRTTIVQSFNGTINYIPNRNITIVSNLSRSNMQALIKLPMRPDVDLAAVTQVINDVNHRLVPTHKMIKSGPDVLGLTDNGDGTFSYQVLMFVENGQQLPIQREFLAAYVQALADAGIDIPTPTLTLNNH